MYTDFVETFFKHMATPGTEIDWRTFDVARALSKLEAISRLANATDAQLGPYRKRGGKLLMYLGWADVLGWADTGVDPLRGIAYYDAVRAAMGPDMPGFFRLFMLPGVFHCGDGAGPDLFDPLSPIVDWVERGVPPDRLQASRRSGTKSFGRAPCVPTR